MNITDCFISNEDAAVLQNVITYCGIGVVVLVSGCVIRCLCCRKICC